jgi:hypothetical protein
LISTCCTFTDPIYFFPPNIASPKYFLIEKYMNDFTGKKSDLVNSACALEKYFNEQEFSTKASVFPSVNQKRDAFWYQHSQHEFFSWSSIFSASTLFPLEILLNTR